MPTKSLADAKVTRLQADTPSTSGNLTDLEWNFYSPQSGLTPASKFSIVDHKIAYYRLQGMGPGSIRDIETAYFRAQGAVGNSYDDLRYDFYTNRQFFLPSALANLELWLEADNISGAVLASDSFDRSKNLLTNQSMESGTAGYSTPNGSTIAASAVQVHSGTQSLLVTLPAHTGGGFSGIGQSIPNFSPNITVTLSVWVYNPTTGGAVNGVQLSAQGAAMGGAVNGPVNATKDAWFRISLTVTTSSLGNLTTYLLGGGTTLAGEFFYTDDWQVELGSKATQFIWGDSTHLGTTDQGQSWTQTSTAGIAGGSAVLNAANMAYVDTGVVDQVVSIESTISGAGQSVSPLIRGIDANNFIFARVFQTNDQLEIYKMDGGVTGQLANSAALGAGSPVPWRVVLSAVGNLIIITATRLDNGATYSINYTLTGADATKFNAVGATRAGWRSNNATQTFDNFVVKTPIYSDGAALPVWPDKSGYARHALQTTVAKQPLLRSASPNLLTYNQATIEVDATGWINQTNATLARSTAQAASGSASLSVTSVAAGPVAVRINPSRIPVAPNLQYSFQVAFRADAVPQNSCKVQLDWFDIGGTYITSTVGSTITDATTGWTVATVSGTSPSNAAQLNLVALYTASGAGEIHYIDNAGSYLGGLPAAWLPPVSLPNSKPAVQFDGVDDWLASLVGNLVQPYTLFALARTETTGTSQWITSNGISGAGAELGLLSGGALRINAGASIDVLSQVDTSWHDYAGEFNGVSSVSRKDGVQVGSGNAGAGGAVNIAIGTRDTPTNGSPLKGTISAIIAFSRVLSTTERQQVERYLKNKYALP